MAPPQRRGRDRAENRFPTAKNMSGDKMTPQAVETVLKALAEGRSRRYACDAVKIGRSTFNHWMDRDPIFKQNVADAEQRGTEFLEDEARRRAVEGTDKPVYQGGELVGHIREYSDQLLMFTLRGRAPHKYSKQALEVSGPNGRPIETTNLTPQEAAERVKELGISAVIFDRSGDNSDEDDNGG